MCFAHSLAPFQFSTFNAVCEKLNRMYNQLTMNLFRTLTRHPISTMGLIPTVLSNAPLRTASMNFMISSQKSYVMCRKLFSKYKVCTYPFGANTPVISKQRSIAEALRFYSDPFYLPVIYFSNIIDIKHLEYASILNDHAENIEKIDLVQFFIHLKAVNAQIKELQIMYITSAGQEKQLNECAECLKQIRETEKLVGNFTAILHGLTEHYPKLIAEEPDCDVYVKSIVNPNSVWVVDNIVNNKTMNRSQYWDDLIKYHDKYFD